MNLRLRRGFERHTDPHQPGSYGLVMAGGRGLALRYRLQRLFRRPPSKPVAVAVNDVLGR